MKSKLIDKKIIFLFIIMIVMIVFMVSFLNKQKENLPEELDIGIGGKLDMLNRKQKEINNLLDNGGIFSDGLQEIFKKLDLISYIDLPLEIGSYRNNYPFGNKVDSE